MRMIIPTHAHIHVYSHTHSEGQKHPVWLRCAKTSQRQQEQCPQDGRVAVWKKMGERFIPSHVLYNNSAMLGTGHGNGTWEWGATRKVASKPLTCCCVSFTLTCGLSSTASPCLMPHTCIFSLTEQDLYPVWWPIVNILAMGHYYRRFKCTVVFDCMKYMYLYMHMCMKKGDSLCRWVWSTRLMVLSSISSPPPLWLII